MKRTVPQEAPIDSKTLADVIAQVAADKKAYDIVLLDVAELVGYADIFVLCSARNTRQVRGIAEEVRRVLKTEHSLPPTGTEGAETGRWVLVDYDDVVVHVFDEASRAFYDLEGLWADAPRLPAPEGIEQQAPFFSMP